MTSVNPAVLSTPILISGQAANTASPVDVAAFQALLAQQVLAPAAQANKIVATEQTAVPALAEWLSALATAGRTASSVASPASAEAQPATTSGKPGAGERASAAQPAGNALDGLMALPLSIQLPVLPNQNIPVTSIQIDGGLRVSGSQAAASLSPTGAAAGVQSLGTVSRTPAVTIDATQGTSAAPSIEMPGNPAKHTAAVSAPAAAPSQAITPGDALPASGAKVGKLEAAEPVATPQPVQIAGEATAQQSPSPLAVETSAVSAGRVYATAAIPNPAESVDRPQPAGRERESSRLPASGIASNASPEQPELKTRRVSGIVDRADRSEQPIDPNAQGQAVVSQAAAAPAADTVLSLSDTQRAAVTSQVTEAVLRASARRPSEVRIVLDPPALGSLNVKVVSHRGSLEVQLGAASESVRSMLENHLPSLRAALADQGLSQADFHVFVGGQAQHFNQSQAEQRGATPQAAPQVREEKAAEPEPTELRSAGPGYRTEGVDYRA